MSNSTYNTPKTQPLMLDQATPDASYEGEEVFPCYFTFEGLMGGWSALREVAEATEPWHDDPAHVALVLDRLADVYKALACLTTAIMQMEQKGARALSARHAVAAATDDTLRRAEGRGWDA